jgi:hypothetical protein
LASTRTVPSGLVWLETVTAAALAIEAGTTDVTCTSPASATAEASARALPRVRGDLVSDESPQAVGLKVRINLLPLLVSSFIQVENDPVLPTYEQSGKMDPRGQRSRRGTGRQELEIAFLVARSAALAGNAGSDLVQSKA